MTDLPAGRELDALVAEKVMGCKVVVEAGVHCCACLGMSSKYGPHSEEGTFGVLPSYSADIAAAWEVVEYIQGKDWMAPFMGPALSGHESRPEWFCNFIGAMETGVVFVPTLPLAICRAALLWAEKKNA